ILGIGDIESLWEPNKTSHKNKNGKVLYIADNSDHMDLIKPTMAEYVTEISAFYFNPKSGKSSSSKIKNITEGELLKEITEADSILFGNIDLNIISLALIK